MRKKLYLLRTLKIHLNFLICFLVRICLIVTNYGVTGSLLNVNVDGASGRQTLITVDGMKLNDGSNGEFDLSLIEPELLSSVTGIRNNASPMYGANASGGVLEMRGFNFSDDKIGFSFGSHNYRKMFFRKMLDSKTSFFYVE